MDGSPNLLPDPSLENVEDGLTAGWSEQRKYTWLGPTYYIWTDWYHFHQPNRGQVASDDLISHSGRRSLRFDVLPGDEKYVESPRIQLNQDEPRLIEVGAMVRADRVKLIDIRAVDQNDVDLPCARPRHPEMKATPGSTIRATAIYGNGSFGWRYVRKVFKPRFGQGLESVKVRLCARGFNGAYFDDGGTRHYARQAGTVWWDDIHVVERASNAGQLQARGVDIPAQAGPSEPAVNVTEIDFGERLVGPDRVRLKVENAGGTEFKLTRTGPDGEKTESTARPNANGEVVLPYSTPEPVVKFENPAVLQLTATRNRQELGSTKLSYYTWPKTADFDFERHMNHPDENPCPVRSTSG